eukprot:1152183-Pelagomonas_calceolata.AAC.6
MVELTKADKAEQLLQHLGPHLAWLRCLVATLQQSGRATSARPGSIHPIYKQADPEYGWHQGIDPGSTGCAKATHAQPPAGLPPWPGHASRAYTTPGHAYALHHESVPSTPAATMRKHAAAATISQHAAAVMHGHTTAAIVYGHAAASIMYGHATAA